MRSPFHMDVCYAVTGASRRHASPGSLMNYSLSMFAISRLCRSFILLLFLSFFFLWVSTIIGKRKKGKRESITEGTRNIKRINVYVRLLIQCTWAISHLAPTDKIIYEIYLYFLVMTRKINRRDFRKRSAPVNSAGLPWEHPLCRLKGRAGPTTERPWCMERGGGQHPCPPPRRPECAHNLRAFRRQGTKHS